MLLWLSRPGALAPSILQVSVNLERLTLARACGGARPLWGGRAEPSTRLPRAYLELVCFLGQLHAESVPFRHLGVEFLHLRVEFLPLVLGLGLDLLQHLDLARQLLVVGLQALLVLLKIRFELGGEGRETCYF